MEKTLPIIDMQGFPAEYERLRDAGENWGCFRLANHPIPSSLMSEMKNVSKTLFSLPSQVKLRNSGEVPATTYIPPSEFNPLFESFGFLYFGSPEASHDFCSQLNASPSQREVIERYTKAVHELIVDLARKVGESFGLNQSNLFEDWVMQFRMNKYDFGPESVSKPGLELHTDYGFITILQDDEEVGGLEVVDKSGEFVAVKPEPAGTLLVNLGDAAKAWSNGRLYSVKHRVESKQTGVRISIAAFLVGPERAKIEAPPELVDSDHPRLYVPYFYEDQKMLRIQTNMHAGETLELLRIKSS